MCGIILENGLFLFKKGDVMSALVESFLTYGIIMILLAALAVAGIFIGKALRQKKDLKKKNNTEE